MKLQNGTELGSALLEMKTADVKKLLATRLQGEPDQKLPALGRDEDPSDIFLEAFDEYGVKLDGLKEACAELENDWVQLPMARLKKRAEAVGELHFLCARIGATAAAPPLAEFALRDELHKCRLNSGEDLQSRALRALSGLLDEPDVKPEHYRQIFEAALSRPNHVAVGLLTLIRFWPSERTAFVTTAAKLGTGEASDIIKNLDELLKLNA